MAKRIAQPRPKVTVTITSPLVTDDVSKGYQYFSLWYNTITGELFTCVDPSVGVAVWKEGAAGGAVVVKTVDPTSIDDVTKGYQVGTLWLNTTTPELWVSIVDTLNNSVWRKTMAALDGEYEIPALTTTGDGQIAMTPAIQQTPEHDVIVRVNNVPYKAARNQSEKLTSPCYFSSDGGGTVTSIGSVAGGADKLYWNGSVVGFQLGTTDRISLVYEV